MSKRFFFHVLGLVLAGQLIAAEPAEPPVNVAADRLEYVGAQVVLEGNVVVTYNSDTMEADHVTVNPTTGDSYASGNVRLTRAGNCWEGEEVSYNFKTGVGEFGEFKANAGAFRITAGDSKRLNEHEIWLKDVTLSTCADDDIPYYSIEISECVLIDEHIIKAKHASVWLGHLPIFYLPYVKRDLNGGLVNTQIGQSNDLGVYLRNRITYDIDEHIRAKSHVDLYSNRGVGVGQDLRSRYDSGETELGFYYINDSSAAEENQIASTDPDAGEYGSDRFRIRVDSTASRAADEKDYLKARLNIWSDPDVVENFFSAEYREQSQPETNIGIARSDDESTFGLSSVYQFSSAYESVNRLPELSFDRYRKPLGADFFYRSETDLAYLEKRDNNHVTEKDEYDALRFDSFHQIERPFEFFDFLNVTPRTSYRGTFYSDGPDGDAEFRNLFEFGTEASFKAYKVLTDKPGWYGDGLRHMVQPYVNYTFRPRSSLQATNIYTGASVDLYRFDEIDDLDETNEISFGVRNVLQTRKYNRVRKLMDLDLYTTVDLEPEEDEREFDTLNADLEFWINDHLNAELDLEYDYYEHEFNPFNVRLESTRDDGSYFRTEYRWRDDFSNIFLTQASLWPTRKYSVDTYTRYNFDDQEFEDSSLVLKRKFSCIGLGLGYSYDETDSQIWLYMWILEFGEDSPFNK